MSHLVNETHSLYFTPLTGLGTGVLVCEVVLHPKQNVVVVGILSSLRSPGPD